MLAIILVAGFVEVAYIGGQSMVDRYLKVAELAVNAGHALEIGDLTTKPGTPTVLPKGDEK